MARWNATTSSLRARGGSSAVVAVQREPLQAERDRASDNRRGQLRERPALTGEIEAQQTASMLDTCPRSGPLRR
jgi:hypothetical protein